MSNRVRFAGRYRAADYQYPPFFIDTGCAAGAGQSITLAFGQNSLTDGSNLAPLATTCPILVGSGSTQETVTPSAVSAGTPGVYNTAVVTGTFTYAHGVGEQVASATYGLQEAINKAYADGGGIVVVDAVWFAIGGTATIIGNANLPYSGVVQIEDVVNKLIYSAAPNSLSVVAAPSAPTSSTVASTTATGSWTAGTVYVQFTYVTPNGGESAASSGYSFTSTVSKAIGGSGPAAATGAVGYRVYIGVVGGGATTYLVPVTSSNGTVIQCGPLAAFQIGTSFSVAAVTVNTAALVPNQSNAFTSVIPKPYAAPYMAQKFQTVSGPFTATGVVTAGTALEWGKIQLPTAFLNSLNRTLRITLQGYWTPVSTATLILSCAIGSIYAQTETTVYTCTTPASTGTSAANINTVIILRVSATGASGTVECHATNLAGLTTGTAGLLAASGDSVQAVSSGIDLTAQNYIRFMINSGAANITQSQLRTAIVEVLQ